ncbi:putative integral membrane protein [Leishmania donovani]|uniref:Putative integral membrane protein n=1 Tax=Leishmania donovani TaxID=5661 RepID=A0A504Y190_LEIDO|nr:putative integral membrane protein [Leishmania donovani]
MAQQHPHRRYEGYAYPTEFQSAPTGSRDSGGGAYFGRERIPSPSATSLSGATGLVRRSVQHTGAAAVATASTGANAASYQGSYGYFHGQGNSIDITSGYNSDAGSSTSNPLYGGGGRSGYIVPNTSSQHQEVVVGTSRSSAGASGANSTEPSPGVWAAEPGVNGLTASGRRLSKLPPRLHEPGIFQPSSDGSAGSITNSTIGSNSARPPTQQTFLPSEPNLQRGTASGAAPPEAAFVQHSSSCAASPINMSGPRMPAAYDASASPNIAGGAVFGSGRTSGFLGRLIAQVLPVVDDSAGDPGSGIGAGSAAPIGERPLHQLRFGNPADDLPLLEELGIFPRHILGKARAVLNPFKSISVDAAKDTDLAGPVLFALSLAVLLSLRGKIQFSAIYGLFMLGVGFFKMLLSLMQPRGGVPLQFVASTIGYGLLPTVLLAAVRTVGSWIMGLRGVLPLTLLMVAWSSWCGTTLVAKGLGMEEQRYLVLYPMLLFYSTFNVVAVY